MLPAHQSLPQLAVVRKQKLARGAHGEKIFSSSNNKMAFPLICVNSVNIYFDEKNKRTDYV